MNAGSESPLSSIIVVTWNARRYVDQCLRSLAENAASVGAEIIVVDNSSSDGTAEWIARALPQAVLLQNSANLGFAKGNNLGIARSRGKYLFLINSDVTVPPGCLEKLLAVMESDNTIGLLGPRMLSPQMLSPEMLSPEMPGPHAMGPPKLASQPEARRSTMRFPTLWNQFCRALGIDSIFKSPWAGGFLMPDFRHDHTREVDVLNGWFWLVRREAVEQVGPLDERFFMYGEDMDWCLRFQQAAWRRVFCAEAGALHYGGASSAAAPVRFHLEMQRANFQFWSKHHGAPSQLAYLTITLLHQLIRIAGYGLAWLAGIGPRSESAYKVKRSLAVLRWLPDALRQWNTAGPRVPAALVNSPANSSSSCVEAAMEAMPATMPASAGGTVKS